MLLVHSWKTSKIGTYEAKGNRVGRGKNTIIMNVISAKMKRMVNVIYNNFFVNFWGYGKTKEHHDGSWNTNGELPTSWRIAKLLSKYYFKCSIKRGRYWFYAEWDGKIGKTPLGEISKCIQKKNINRTLVKRELQFEILRQQVLHRCKWIPCKWFLYINIWHYIRILYFNALQRNKCSKLFGIIDFCFQWNIFLCVRIRKQLNSYPSTRITFPCTYFIAIILRLYGCYFK